MWTPVQRKVCINKASKLGVHEHKVGLVEVKAAQKKDTGTHVDMAEVLPWETDLRTWSTNVWIS